ncbi:MAG: TetR family transcriptional regulator C-terminal domain-containing protein, partial [Candidatus Rokuibacteriota bacterium]
LAALVGVCVDPAVRRRELWAVFIEFWGEMLHDRRLAGINADQYARMRRLVGALVARGIREGRFRRVDPRAAGAVVLGLVDGVSLQVLFDPGALTPATATRLCVDAARRYLEG